MKKAFSRVLLLIVLVLPVYLTFFANKNQIRSVPVISLKDQLSNAQLSFFGRLTSANGTIIKIGNTTVPSKITGNLATGDTIAIANGAATSAIYTVRDIGDTATIELASSVGTTIANSYIIATRSAIHTVSFIPQTSANGERWQFLIKATDRIGENAFDGIPDQTGFDLGSTQPGGPATGLGTRLQAADITCPNSGVATIGTTMVVGLDMINSGYTGAYHIIQCATAVGTSNSLTTTTISIGRALTTGSQLINPSPGIIHTVGQANNISDTFAYGVRQLDNLGNVIDTTFGKLAVTESVRVTAIVDPTITFTIGTSNTTTVGTNRCGSALSNGADNSTATDITFGPLILGTFNNLAQSLHCTTNSQNGYVIQAFENRPMTMLGSTTTLPNTNCNGNGCSSTTAAAWSSFNLSGFGYSLEVGTTSAGATFGITTSGQYKAFGVGNGNAQSIMYRSNTPAATDSVYICYRAVASTTQQAGTYENSISFIATATF